jgi:hypothetical protein
MNRPSQLETLILDHRGIISELKNSFGGASRDRNKFFKSLILLNYLKAININLDPCHSKYAAILSPPYLEAILSP